MDFFTDLSTTKKEVQIAYTNRIRQMASRPGRPFPIFYTFLIKARFARKISFFLVSRKPKFFFFVYLF